jgi:hypothetical protein
MGTFEKSNLTFLRIRRFPLLVSCFSFDWMIYGPKSRDPVRKKSRPSGGTSIVLGLRAAVFRRVETTYGTRAIARVLEVIGRSRGD